jgi:NTE family protein
MNERVEISPIAASLVLGGGVGLGAFQLGAFEILSAADAIDIRSVSGTSIGAINGAIIAGNAPEARLEKLQSFWKRITVEAMPTPWADPWGWASEGTLRRMRNWTNALATGLNGSPGLFVPHIFGGRGETRSLYDNSAIAGTLRSCIDFDRLNSGDVRFCLSATDIEAGEVVFFDTAKGDQIGVDHLIASSSLMPAFEPIRIDDRLLADGGFACNVPLEAEIGPARLGVAEPVCFVLDLFTPEGGRPAPLNQAISRSIDLTFGMQTRMRLAAFEREWALRAQLQQTANEPLASAREQGVDLFYMSYRGREEDAGFGKPFDLSPETLSDRIAEGRASAERALSAWATRSQQEAPNLRVHRID